MVTYLSSYKQLKLDKQVIWGTAEEVRTNLLVTFFEVAPELTNQQGLTYISSVRPLDAVFRTGQE